jgi:hypothetical protein
LLGLSPIFRPSGIRLPHRVPSCDLFFPYSGPTGAAGMSARIALLYPAVLCSRVLLADDRNAVVTLTLVLGSSFSVAPSRTLPLQTVVLRAAFGQYAQQLETPLSS